MRITSTCAPAWAIVKGLNMLASTILGQEIRTDRRGSAAIGESLSVTDGQYSAVTYESIDNDVVADADSL